MTASMEHVQRLGLLFLPRQRGCPQPWIADCPVGNLLTAMRRDAPLYGTIHAALGDFRHWRRAFGRLGEAFGRCEISGRAPLKLRILGNSVRIRVSRAELSRVATDGLVRQKVWFGAGETLAYELRCVADGEVRATFADRCVSVRVPRTVVERWRRPEQVSIRGKQALPGGGSLSILVEKDFQCLAPREGEDQSALFPNPRMPES